MRFDFTDLRLFHHVAQTGSITRGAERAHLALASASARIRGMEEMLGVPLLKRGRRGVEPTDAGRSLLDHARIVLQQMETMRGDLGAYSRGLKGSVRILANTSALSEHLPALLAVFLAANPTIDVDLEDRESPAIGLTKDELVQALGLSFTVSTLALAATLVGGAGLEMGLAWPSAAGVVVALAGMRLGQAVRVRLSPQAFRLWFFVGLLALGAYLAARGLV